MITIYFLVIMEKFIDSNIKKIEKKEELQFWMV